MPVTAVFFCFRGYLYVCNEIDNGPSGELEFVHLTTLEEGSFFGEQSFLARQSGHSALATATVEAGTYCELERLPFDGLQLLMAQEPELLKAIKAQARAAHVRNVGMAERERAPEMRRPSHAAGRRPSGTQAGVKRKGSLRKASKSGQNLLLSVKDRTDRRGSHLRKTHKPVAPIATAGDGASNSN